MQLSKEQFQEIFNQNIPGFTVTHVMKHPKGGWNVFADGQHLKGRVFRATLTKGELFIDCINPDAE